MITKPSHLVSARHYADMCGVSRKNIYTRIKAGTVSCVKISIYYFIDITKTPPQKRILTRTKVNMPRAYVPPEMDVKRLVAVKTFAEKRGMRTDRIFEMILLDKLNAFIISDVILVNKDEVITLLKLT